MALLSELKLWQVVKVVEGGHAGKTGVIVYLESWGYNDYVTIRLANDRLISVYARKVCLMENGFTE